MWLAFFSFFPALKLVIWGGKDGLDGWGGIDEGGREGGEEGVHFRQTILSQLYFDARALREGSMMPPRRRRTRWRVDSCSMQISSAFRFAKSKFPLLVRLLLLSLPQSHLVSFPTNLSVSCKKVLVEAS